MTSFLARLSLALALAMPAIAAPAPNSIVARQKGACTGQSCSIADISGSSGIAYTSSVAITGGTDSGDCCIISYNPAAASVLYAQTPGLTCPSSRKAIKNRHAAAAQIEEVKRATCLPYTLIYARGTSEPGTIGITVGPALKSALAAIQPGKWSIQGVAYDATDDGDYCLGLPGGAIASTLINTVASSCPNTKIIVSGYSEGAMVAHNGVAGASAAAVKKIAGVLVFGDPFNGSPIKGYSGPIITYCATGDYVCSGEFIITAAHLSYVGADTTAGAQQIANLVS